MKTIKIILVAVILAAVGFVTYLLIKSGPDGPIIPEDSIPEGCKYIGEHYAYVDSVFNAIPYGDFRKLDNTNKSLKTEYDGLMADAMNDCRDAMQIHIHGDYRNRFVEMADKEFEGEVWKNFDIVSKTNASMLKEDPESPRLQRISRICKEYDRVRAFMGRLRSQCGQSPSSINSEWNVNNTRDIISSIPSASDPVSHTAKYTEARRAKEKLYNAHVSFLEDLIDLTKDEIPENASKADKINAFKHANHELDEFGKLGSLYGREVKGKANELKGKMK